VNKPTTPQGKPNDEQLRWAMEIIDADQDAGPEATAAAIVLKALRHLQSESGQMAKPEYLIDGKPYKTCDCRDNTDECPHGRKRTLLTTGFSRCVVPDLEEWVRMVEAKQTPSATASTVMTEALAFFMAQAFGDGFFDDDYETKERVRAWLLKAQIRDDITVQEVVDSVIGAVDSRSKGA